MLIVIIEFILYLAVLNGRVFLQINLTLKKIEGYIFLASKVNLLPLHLTAKHIILQIRMLLMMQNTGYM